MSEGISSSMTRKELESTGVYLKLSAEKKKELKKLTKGLFFEALRKETDKGERKSPRKSPVKEIEIKSPKRSSKEKEENVTIIVNLVTKYLETNNRDSYSNPNYLSEDDNVIQSDSESNMFYLIRQESKAEDLIDLLDRWKDYSGVVVRSGRDDIILTKQHGLFEDRPITITEEEIKPFYKYKMGMGMGSGGFFKGWSSVESGKKIPCNGFILFFKIIVSSLTYDPKKE